MTLFEIDTFFYHKKHFDSSQRNNKKYNNAIRNYQ